MRRKVLVGLAVVGVAAAAGGAYFWFGSPAQEVRLPGTVEVQEVRLASKVGGRVVAVGVHEGQVVQAGQVLITFDPAELTARRDQARAKFDAAKAALDKANAGPLPEEIAEAAGAADAARARYARAKAGPREQEKEKAKNDLDAAIAEVAMAKDEHDRAAESIKAGVGSASQYQITLAVLDRAKARVAAARSALDLLVSGYREEDVAEAAGELARLNARHEFLRRGTRYEDKAAAAANVASAEAELAEAETRLREAVVVAPERCVVDVLAVRPGDVTQPGQPVARVLRADDLWVKVFVPSTELGNIRLDQPVGVQVDSHPGRRFAGRVVHIASVSEFTPRNVQSPDERKHQVFAVKVRVSDPEGVFKSGMAADVFVKPER
jgi:multidrug resistance efflux pump